MLAWDPALGRVRLKSHDPGFYFPVFDDDADPGDYPRRVHLAWEIPADPRRDVKARVRRITYELGPISPATRSHLDHDGRATRRPLQDGAGNYVLEVRDRFDAEVGQVERV